jgi:demethylmenaquinone methyltransferase/2-methoxy-6-polyprenyl-1,4-benzoquinol methylase
MLEVAAERIPGAEFVVGDALELPFEDGSFERIATGHFYGHLEEADRVRFLSEARRVATELVVIDSALHDGVEPIEWQERLLKDGSRWEVYKRYFVASELADELGDGEVLFDGNWFVVVRSRG